MIHNPLKQSWTWTDHDPRINKNNNLMSLWFHLLCLSFSHIITYLLAARALFQTLLARLYTWKPRETMHHHGCYCDSLHIRYNDAFLWKMKSKIQPGLWINESSCSSLKLLNAGWEKLYSPFSDKPEYLKYHVICWVGSLYHICDGLNMVLIPWSSVKGYRSSRLPIASHSGSSLLAINNMYSNI